jgi:hypothetical protein
MDTTGCKHRDLEFSTDWRSTPWLGSDCWHQINFSLDVTFRFSWESLDTPYDSLLLWLILCAAKRVLNFCLSSVLGDGYLDDDVGGE